MGHRPPSGGPEDSGVPGRLGPGGPQQFVATPGRLDQVVARRLGVPRAEVQRAIEEGRVRVEGRAREKSFRLAGGERVEVDLRGPGELPPDPTPVRVLHEDPYLLVVSKPPGVLTHPTPSRRSGTLVNRLLAMGVPLSSGSEPDRPGIVHRLDAGTSGALVVAKDDRTHELLAGMFRRHEVERRYLALVRGAVAEDRLLVEAPLGREGARVRVRPVTGREAATEVEVRERLPRATLVEARPHTGRTHQIRVHLAALGHPVLGDRAYGGGGDPAARLGLARPFLHAWRLALLHPRTGEPVEVEDPLPPDLEAALARARLE
ncbi:MAG TPA: RluA family pseudouridine synthase [Actinomycetota bacterium]|nr:RluA family pseudouridine synthase [Actinomycetota bacterium]